MKIKTINIFFFLIMFASFTVAVGIEDVEIEELNEGFYVYYPITESSQNLIGSVLINDINYYLSENNQIFIKNLECSNDYNIKIKNSTDEINLIKTTTNEIPVFIINDYDVDNVNYLRNTIFTLVINGTKYSEYFFKLNGYDYNPELIEENENNIKYKIVLNNNQDQEQILSIESKSCDKFSDEVEVKFKLDKVNPTLIINKNIDDETGNVTFVIKPSEIGSLKILKDGEIEDEKECDSIQEVTYEYELDQLDNKFLFQYVDVSGNSYSREEIVNYDSKVENLTINEIDLAQPRIFLYGTQKFTGKTDANSNIKLYLLDSGKTLENLCEEDEDCQIEVLDDSTSGEFDIDIDYGILKINSSGNFDIYQYAVENNLDVEEYNDGENGIESYLVGTVKFDIMNLFINKEFESDDDGYFEFTTYLAGGENEYVLEVTDPSGNKLLKRYNITRADNDLIWDINIGDLPDLTIEYIDSDLDYEVRLSDASFTYMGTLNESGDKPFLSVGSITYPQDVEDNYLLLDASASKKIQTEVDGKEMAFVDIVLEFDKEKLKELFNGDFTQDFYITIDSLRIVTGIGEDDRITLAPMRFHMKGYTGYLIPPEFAKDTADILNEIHNATSEYILPFVMNAITVDLGLCIGTMAFDYLETIGIKSNNRQEGCEDGVYDGDKCVDPRSAYLESMYVCNRITCPEVPNLEEESLVYYYDEFSLGENFKVGSDTGFQAIGNVEELSEADQKYKYTISWTDGQGESDTLKTEISKEELCEFASLNDFQCANVFSNTEMENELYVAYMEDLLYENIQTRPFSDEVPFFDQTKRIISFDRKRTSTMQNPYENIISSIETVCLPGIYTNINKYNTILKEVADCFESLSETGQDFSFCQQLLGYHICDGVSAAFNYVIPSQSANNLAEELSIDVDINSVDGFSKYLSTLISDKDKYSSSSLDALLSTSSSLGTSYNEKINQVCVAAIDYDWSSGNFLDFATDAIIENAIDAAAKETAPEIAAWGSARKYSSIHVDGTLDFRYTIQLGAVNLETIDDISLACHSFDDDEFNSNVACLGTGSKTLNIERNFVVSDVTNKFEKVDEHTNYIYNAIKVTYYDESQNMEVEKYFPIVNLNPSGILSGFDCKINYGGFSCGTDFSDQIISVNNNGYLSNLRYTRIIPSDKLYVGDEIFLTYYLEDMKDDVYLELLYPNIFSDTNIYEKKQYLLEYTGQDTAFYVIKVDEVIPEESTSTECVQTAPYYINNFLNVNVDNIDSVLIEGYNSDYEFSIKYGENIVLKSVNDINEDIKNSRSFLYELSGKNPKILTNLKYTGDNGKLIFNMNDGTEESFVFQSTCESINYDVSRSSFDLTWSLKRDTDNDNIGDSPYLYYESGGYEEITGDYTLNVKNEKRTSPIFDLIYPLYMQNKISFKTYNDYYFVAMPQETGIELNLSTINVISGETFGAKEEEYSGLITYSNGWETNNDDFSINSEDLPSFSFLTDIMNSEEGYETKWSITNKYEENEGSDSFFFLKKNDNIDSELEQIPLRYIDDRNSIELD